LNNEYSLLKNEHLPRYLLLMAIAFAAFAHSRKKGEGSETWAIQGRNATYKGMSCSITDKGRNVDEKAPI